MAVNSAFLKFSERLAKKAAATLRLPKQFRMACEDKFQKLQELAMYLGRLTAEVGGKDSRADVSRCPRRDGKSRTGSQRGRGSTHSGPSIADLYVRSGKLDSIRKRILTKYCANA